VTKGDQDLVSPRASIRGGDIVISLGHRRALFGNAAFDAPREACETVGEAFETRHVPFTRLVRSLTNLDEPLATSRASFAAARVAFARTRGECVHTRVDAACTQLEVPRPHLEAVRTSLEAARANADDAHRSGRLRAHSVPVRAATRHARTVSRDHTRAHVARRLTAIAFATPLLTLPQLP
jgi:hypothetical protein